MYCTQCHAEYRPGITVCTDCRIELTTSAGGAEPWKPLADYFRAPQSTRDQCRPGPFADPSPQELALRWAEYRRHKTTYHVYSAFVLVFVVLGALTQWFAGRNLTVTIAISACGALFLAFGVVVQFRYLEFPCPRCRKRGGFRMLFVNWEARRCRRCGLPRPYDVR